MERQIITVDIAPGNNQIQRLKSSQGDIGRPLGVYIIQNGVALDCSAYTADLYILKPDGNFFTGTATVDATEHNLITWETAEQETPVAGDCAAQIRILSNGDDIGTARFVEYVEASPGFCGEASESVVESLKEYVRQAAASAETASGAASSATGSASAASGSASAAASSASAAAGSASTAHTDAETASQAAQTAQDVAASIPSDYTQLSEDVTGLKSAFDEKVNSRYGSEFSPNLIANDESITMGYVAKNGSIYSSTNQAYTDYIPVEPGYILRAYYTKQGVFAQKNLRFVCCYDQSKTPVSSAGTNNAVSTFTVPEDIAFVRVTFEGVSETGGLATNNYTLSVNCTPTEYTAYTPLKADITEDFLTRESETFLAGLMENGISSNNITNKYGCALPQTKIFQTIGLPEKWYNDSMVTPPMTNIEVSAGSQYTSKSNDGISFLNTTALTSANGYNWRWYDVFYSLIKSSTGNSGLGWARRYIAENLTDCSLLVIGDSTVDHDTMTATLLSHFAEQGHILTLLGTLGDDSGTNKNEGRAGWSAQDYLTDRQYQGVTNPFYNPTAQTFDFAYYMANQGYTGVDFVVIQLGINDLYNYDDTKIVPTWDAVSAMIDSILAYNSGIKIILNLPTTPNSNQAELNVAEFLYRNRVIRYNEYAMAQSLAKYGTTKVRCSYCHLILDSHTEIRDNVHPTTEGYQKMALEVVNQINCWQAGV